MTVRVGNSQPPYVLSEELLSGIENNYSVTKNLEDRQLFYSFTCDQNIGFKLQLDSHNFIPSASL